MESNSMSRAEKFAQDIIGTAILMTIAGPIIRGVIAFIAWKHPSDWMSFWGLTLADARMSLGIALLYALYQQVMFRRGDCK